ncbi:hypothetical protein F4809DRAFT_654356 [Biscogniauxia mediterranea]|nr:hypothetical protein F4809DRAFT_654356 [Biscogniauxia mediterranea]
MPRRRPTHGGIRLPGNKQKRIKLRTLMPRIGFDFVDKRCRAMLTGVGSSLIKEQIYNFFFEMNKATVDKALAMLLKKATKVMENDPEQIADMMPGEFWGAIKQTVPWAKDLSGSIIFSLVAALLAAHETCLETYPYERYSIYYGRLATSTHNFSMLLQQHHMDNYLLMSIYYDTAMALGNESDDESASESEEDEEAQAGTKRKQDEMEPSAGGGCCTSRVEGSLAILSK